MVSTWPHSQLPLYTSLARGPPSWLLPGKVGGSWGAWWAGTEPKGQTPHGHPQPPAYSHGLGTPCTPGREVNPCTLSQGVVPAAAAHTSLSLAPGDLWSCLPSEARLAQLCPLEVGA